MIKFYIHVFINRETSKYETKHSHELLDPLEEEAQVVVERLSGVTGRVGGFLRTSNRGILSIQFFFSNSVLGLLSGAPSLISYHRRHILTCRLQL